MDATYHSTTLHCPDLIRPAPGAGNLRREWSRFQREPMISLASTELSNGLENPIRGSHRLALRTRVSYTILVLRLFALVSTNDWCTQPVIRRARAMDPRSNSLSTSTK